MGCPFLGGSPLSGDAHTQPSRRHLHRALSSPETLSQEEDKDMDSELRSALTLLCPVESMTWVPGDASDKDPLPGSRIKLCQEQLVRVPPTETQTSRSQPHTAAGTWLWDFRPHTLQLASGHGTPGLTHRSWHLATGLPASHTAAGTWPRDSWPHTPHMAPGHGTQAHTPHMAPGHRTPGFTHHIWHLVMGLLASHTTCGI